MLFYFFGNLLVRVFDRKVWVVIEFKIYCMDVVNYFLELSCF